MKKILLVGAVTAALGTTATAEELTGQNWCMVKALLAETEMLDRQVNNDLVKQLGRHQDTLKAAKAENETQMIQIAEAQIEMAPDAFKEPQWPYGNHRNKAAKDFSNQVLVECLEGLAK